ncbi:hypothetical protein BDZ45DRAFT_678388 [Acephala macrosclerotiorum]|nr:hypothetical protein BDZ45DRAFT_678388 [Acephala macrosclerotiorum]
MKVHQPSFINPGIIIAKRPDTARNPTLKLQETTTPEPSKQPLGIHETHASAAHRPKKKIT